MASRETITVVLHHDMKAAVLKAAADSGEDVTVWCREALEAKLAGLGVEITWPAVLHRGGYKRCR